MHHNEPRSFFKQLVTIAHVEVHASAAFAVFIDVLRQQKCRRISTLAADVIRDLIHFGSIHERTLYTGQVASRGQQHVATSRSEERRVGKECRRRWRSTELKNTK